MSLRQFEHISEEASNVLRRAADDFNRITKAASDRVEVAIAKWEREYGNAEDQLYADSRRQLDTEQHHSRVPREHVERRGEPIQHHLDATPDSSGVEDGTRKGNGERR